MQPSGYPPYQNPQGQAGRPGYPEHSGHPGYPGQGQGGYPGQPPTRPHFPQGPPGPAAEQWNPVGVSSPHTGPEGDETGKKPRKKWSRKKKLLVFIPSGLVFALGAAFLALVVVVNWTHITGVQPVADDAAGLQYEVSDEWTPFSARLTMGGGEWKMLQYGIGDCHGTKDGKPSQAQVTKASIFTAAYPASASAGKDAALKLFQQIIPSFYEMTTGFKFQDVNNGEHGRWGEVNIDGVQGYKYSVRPAHHGVADCDGGVNTDPDFDNGMVFVALPAKDSSGKPVTAVICYYLMDPTLTIDGYRNLTAADKDEILKSFKVNK
ncbi:MULTISPECIES: hypothetical protein [unclassified Amycolatopsis]|uniref:hypothetical protein n=1 Tax=unclassified Amycolatopsis TaxID=2618356 RepID=UPI00106EB098|nr:MULTISPECIES: hypothetical protein [unclassified Amycolatopsis]